MLGSTALERQSSLDNAIYSYNYQRHELYRFFSCLGSGREYWLSQNRTRACYLSMLKLGNGPPLAAPLSLSALRNRNRYIHPLLVDGGVRRLSRKVLRLHSILQVCPSALLLQRWPQTDRVMCPGLCCRAESKTSLSWYCFCVPLFKETPQVPGPHCPLTAH